MNEILVRKATLIDLNILLTFEQGIIEAERPYDPTLKPEKISYYDIKEMIDAHDVQVVVAVIDEVIVGSGYARIETAKPYLKHNNFGYLGFMYTVPEYRARGVNKAILTFLEKWCLEKEITELRLDVYNDNLAAIKAYEKSGFKKHLINMRLGI